MATRTRLPSNPEALSMMDGPSTADAVDVGLLVVGEQVRFYLDGEEVQTDLTLEDTDPAPGTLFGWVFLSSNHAATCHLENLENLRVWSLD